MKNSLAIIIAIILCISGCTSNDQVTVNVTQNQSTELHSDAPPKNDTPMTQTTASNIATQQIEIGEIATFGQLDIAEIIYRSEEPENGQMTLEYYSNAPFNDVVKHYEDILKGGDDFDIMRYPGDAYVTMSGLIDNYYVNFSINKEDDREETYVLYQYDATSGDMTEVEDVALSDEMRQTIKSEMINALENEHGIIIRKIGDYSYEEFMRDFDQIGYPQNMIVQIEGTTTDYKTGTANISYLIYIKDGNYHMLTEYDGPQVQATVVSIYNKQRNQTCMYNKKSPGKRVIEDGNNIEAIRMLNAEMFRYMQSSDNDFLAEYIENDDGSRWAWINSSNLSIMYNIDKRIVFDYIEMGKEMYYDDEHPTGIRVPYEHRWRITNINTTTHIENQMFDF